VAGDDFLLDSYSNVAVEVEMVQVFSETTTGNQWSVDNNVVMKVLV
jgi:hypothetical protein